MIRTAITSTALLCLLCGPVRAQAVAPDPLDGCQVIARIGKQVVLSCEVLWRVNLMLEENRDRIPPGELEEVRNQLMQRGLTGMIDMRLLYADFRSKLPEANLAGIHENLEEPFEKERIPQLMKEIGVDDPAKIDARMQELGGSLEDVRQDYYQTMIARSWINEALDFDKAVTHEQLLDYYREHGAKYDYPSKARWEELMVRFSRFDSRDAAWAAIAQMGNEAFAAVAKTTDATAPAFTQVAKAKSQGFNAADGGLHDWTTKGALAADRIDEALFSLRVGEMSPILQSEQGFHIVRVVERKLAGRSPFSEVQKKIESQIVEKRYNAALQKTLTELRRTTTIWTIYGGTMTAEDYLKAQREGLKRR